MSESRDILKEEFHNEEYRHAYAEDFLNTSIATQIRVLREQRGLTQDDLAKQIGTKQAGISRLENVNHSAWKTDTLHKIARAFDVRVRVTFETFGSLVDEAEKFGRKELERPSFHDDPAFHEREAASAQVQTTMAPANNSLLTGPFGRGTTNQPAIFGGSTTIAPSGNNIAVISGDNRVLVSAQKTFTTDLSSISLANTLVSSMQTSNSSCEGRARYVGKPVGTAA